MLSHSKASKLLRGNAKKKFSSKKSKVKNLFNLFDVFLIKNRAQKKSKKQKKLERILGGNQRNGIKIFSRNIFERKIQIHREVIHTKWKRTNPSEVVKEIK